MGQVTGILGCMCVLLKFLILVMSLFLLQSIALRYISSWMKTTCKVGNLVYIDI